MCSLWSLSSSSSSSSPLLLLPAHCCSGAASINVVEWCPQIFKRSDEEQRTNERTNERTKEGTEARRKEGTNWRRKEGSPTTDRPTNEPPPPPPHHHHFDTNTTVTRTTAETSHCHTAEVTTRILYTYIHVVVRSFVRSFILVRSDEKKEELRKVVVVVDGGWRSMSARAIKLVVHHLFDVAVVQHILRDSNRESRSGSSVALRCVALRFLTLMFLSLSLMLVVVDGRSLKARAVLCMLYAFECTT